MEVKNSTGAIIGYEWEPKVKPGAENKFACVPTMKLVFHSEKNSSVNYFIKQMDGNMNLNIFIFF